MKLSTDVIQELVSLRAKIKDLSEKESKLTQQVKSKMEKDHLEEFGPRDSPFKFVFSQFRKISVSWKSEWQTMAKEVYGKKWEKEQARIERRNKQWSDSLTIPVNEKYKKEAA